MAEAAKAAPPTNDTATPAAAASLGCSQGRPAAVEVPSTSGLVGPKASSVEAKPTQRKRNPLERVPVALPEAMDTTSSGKAQTAPKERDVTRRGAAPHLSAAATATRSVTAVKPSAPPVGAASAVPPLANEGQQTPTSAGPRATASAVGPEKLGNVPAERALSTTSEVDTSSSPAASQTPKERRSSLERSKKEKLRITGPEKVS
ncbi:translation initiation factor IF-2-like [Rhipicephalus sanguineus]|uniref:translation initiation factor IF-2-like n=1 Tax=Rhipicephalus sanguineus TaxID=34632 RepID=UPI001893B2BA|nr:translation initiation factor IF-2-like [Rhipicephalus sanguineus]